MSSYSFLICLLGLFGISVSLDNGVALTPPMGWLSWERFGCITNCDDFPETCISERLYLEQANELVQGGFRDAGYQYVDIDDCWSEMERDENGDIMEDRKRFPSGLKFLSQQLHSLGLKFGIYSAIGVKTCVGYPGLEGHFVQDAQKFAFEYEIDSIKVDGCTPNSTCFNITYPAFGEALNKTGRPILYSCSWPAGLEHHGEKPDILNTQLKHTCNSWRSYYDVYDSWPSISSIIDQWTRTSPDDVLVKAAGPGHWNDPDMLVVGNPGLSISEQQAQFCLWSIFAAPLMISADLRTIAGESKRILLNKDVIAVNQDKMGRMGYCVEGKNKHIRVYVRELLPSSGKPCPTGQSDTWAVVLANFMQIFYQQRISFDPLRHLPYGDRWHGFELYDLLEHKHYNKLVFKNFTATVDESSVHMYKIKLQPMSWEQPIQEQRNVVEVDLTGGRSGFVVGNHSVSASR